MITAGESRWWDRGSRSWEIVPRGVEVRVLRDCELLSFVASGEARALRDCLSRMRRDGLRVVFGLRAGEVAVWDQADLCDGANSK